MAQPGQATEPLLQDANRLDKEAVDSKQQIHFRAAILRVHLCKRETITPAKFALLKSEGDIAA